MGRILLVEDDSSIVTTLSAFLKSEGFEVIWAPGQTTALTKIENDTFDLALIDISLTDGNGYAVCAAIKAQKADIPVIFVTASGDEYSVVTGLDMGADDYIPKPFDQSVLIAKVQALLRRAYDFNRNTFTLQAAGAVLNTEDNTLLYNGNKIVLSRNEYMIFLTLMQNKNKVVSREKLMEALWETDSFVDENTLTVNVGRLRRTLEEGGLKDLIKTRFGVGYILEAE